MDTTFCLLTIYFAQKPDLCKYSIESAQRLKAIGFYAEIEISFAWDGVSTLTL